eukprot:TRINITY_DN10572_c0_g2_i2.p1 TRINITY_DN10572_c0_g2~~TRINITY_DN10572_c0_g2_i2.p1  ORF type:complete len:137 (+),score=15.90 TRINITY_DN10572_c0_g2_i2:123-533(+)
MSLTELLSLKADLELALGPLSSNYFDTLAIVLDEGSHAESAAAIEQLQTFVAGSADLAALHNAFIKHLAATQAEQVDPTADEQAVAVSVLDVDHYVSADLDSHRYDHLALKRNPLAPLTTLTLRTILIYSSYRQRR